MGLAIVGRIAEEHGGHLDLRDAADKIPGQRGAWVRMRFSAAGKPEVPAVQNVAQEATQESAAVTAPQMSLNE